MRLTDVDELKKWLKSPVGFRANCEDCTSIDCLNCIIEEAIENAPIVDATPVVHGRWIPCENGGYYCSNCDTRVAFIIHNKFCPHCGAKMDGGVSDG